MALTAGHTEQEAKIVELLAQQDSAAIRLIGQYYQAALIGVIVRIVQDPGLAEDVWQEALIKIWKNGQKYDPAKGRLFTWLLNICRRCAIDMTRSKAFKQRSNIQDDAVLVHTTGEATTEMPQVDTIGLQEVINRLEPKYREVIEYVYLQGYTHIEAAEALQVPLGTLKTRVRVAMNQLRAWLRS